MAAFFWKNLPRSLAKSLKKRRFSATERAAPVAAWFPRSAEVGAGGGEGKPKEEFTSSSSRRDSIQRRKSPPESRDCAAGGLGSFYSFSFLPSPLISFKPYFLTGSYHTMLFISAFLGRLECVLFPFLFHLVPRPITSGKMGLERGLRCVLRTVL